MILAAILLQAVQPAPVPSTAQPDIQLEVNATARRVIVERRGEADLTVYARVNGREGEGNLVEVEAPELPEGRRELNNVTVRVRADVRLPLPENRPPVQEPGSPQ